MKRVALCTGTWSRLCARFLQSEIHSLKISTSACGGLSSCCCESVCVCGWYLPGGGGGFVRAWLAWLQEKMGVKAWLRRKRRDWMTTKKVGRDSVIARKIGRGGVIAKKLGVMAWSRKKIGRDGMTDRKLRRDGEWTLDCPKFRREGLIGQNFRREGAIGTFPKVASDWNLRIFWIWLESLYRHL